MALRDVIDGRLPEAVDRGRLPEVALRTARRLGPTATSSPRIDTASIRRAVSLAAGELGGRAGRPEVPRGSLQQAAAWLETRPRPAQTGGTSPPRAGERAVELPVFVSFTIGSIAAAAVAVLLCRRWRGSRASASDASDGSDPTADLVAVQAAAQGDGEVASAARKLLDATLTDHLPWRWRLHSVLAGDGGALTRQEASALLAAIAPDVPGLRAVAPQPDTPFDFATMRDQDQNRERSGKVVTGLVSGGFRDDAGHVLLPALVRCETVDWRWLRGCPEPLAEMVAADVERFLALPEAGAGTWRASDGWAEGALLVRDHSADELERCSSQLCDDLGAVLREGGLEAPRPIAEVGDEYAATLMIDRDGRPPQRSRVRRVVFAGCAVPGGVALLPAVVVIEPIELGDA